MRKIILLSAVICVLSLHAQNYKLSPFVRQAMMGSKVQSSVSRSKGLNNTSSPVQRIIAFVRTTDTDALREQSCRIYAQWDDICIASIPVNRISVLASMPQIQRIEAGRSCSVTNDTTATITGARELWRMDQPVSTKHPIPNTITGNGVVVGVMDIGFDFTHPTFYSADGQVYRIRQFWDQIDQTGGGVPVVGMTDAGNDTIYVGRQYIGPEALLALQHSYDGLTQTHGSHTTGTAAGSGWDGQVTDTRHQTSNTYSGMAPDADICLVCNAAGDNSDMIPDSLEYLYTTATDMLGFKYIFDYADKVGKPCVINFSEGAFDDLYESGLYSEVLSKMLGPGHILCASAGNEGNKNGTYIHKAEGEASKGAFAVRSSGKTAAYVLKSKKPVSFKLYFYNNGEKVLDRPYDLTELAQFPDSVKTDSVFLGNDTLVVNMETYPSCYDSTLYATDLIMKDVGNKKFGTAIPVSLTLLGEDNDIEAFCCGGYFVSNSLDPSLSDFDHTHNILFPGSSRDVVCVGNSVYRLGFTNYNGKWQTPYPLSEGNGVIAIYSSVGPAISGAIKPDVVAPGMNVISGYNSFFREKNRISDLNDDVSHFTWNGRQYQWHAMSGTSMSTPVVTGIIALWLQVCPSLNPDQVKDVIAHSSMHYDETLTYPNNIYGWGQIDALAGLEYIMKTYTGISQIECGRLKADGLIYTVDGRKLSSINGLHGIFVIDGKKVVR